MADFVFHHLSGAIFGIGLFSAWLGYRWAKEATKKYEEASALYTSVIRERGGAAASVLSEGDSK